MFRSSRSSYSDRRQQRGSSLGTQSSSTGSSYSDTQHRDRPTEWQPPYAESTRSSSTSSGRVAYELPTRDAAHNIQRQSQQIPWGIASSSHSSFSPSNAIPDGGYIDPFNTHTGDSLGFSSQTRGHTSSYVSTTSVHSQRRAPSQLPTVPSAHSSDYNHLENAYSDTGREPQESLSDSFRRRWTQKSTSWFGRLYEDVRSATSLRGGSIHRPAVPRNFDTRQTRSVPTAKQHRGRPSSVQRADGRDRNVPRSRPGKRDPSLIREPPGIFDERFLQKTKRYFRNFENPHQLLDPNAPLPPEYDRTPPAHAPRESNDTGRYPHAQLSRASSQAPSCVYHLHTDLVPPDDCLTRLTNASTISSTSSRVSGHDPYVQYRSPHASRPPSKAPRRGTHQRRPSSNGRISESLARQRNGEQGWDVYDQEPPWYQDQAPYQEPAAAPSFTKSHRSQSPYHRQQTGRNSAWQQNPRPHSATRATAGPVQPSELPAPTVHQPICTCVHTTAPHPHPVSAAPGLAAHASCTCPPPFPAAACNAQCFPQPTYQPHPPHVGVPGSVPTRQNPTQGSKGTKGEASQFFLVDLSGSRKTAAKSPRTAAPASFGRQKSKSPRPQPSRQNNYYFNVFPWTGAQGGGVSSAPGGVAARRRLM